MADEVGGQPPSDGKKGGRMMQMLIIGLLMVGEGVGVFFLANSLNSRPDTAVAAEGASADGGPGEGGAVALAEIELAECRPGNSTSGKYISFNIRVSALVDSADVERAEQLVEEKRARIQDRVNYVIRSAELKQLYEPGFETVRRRVKHEMDQLFDDDTLIKGILIPEMLQ